MLQLTLNKEQSEGEKNGMSGNIMCLRCLAGRWHVCGVKVVSHICLELTELLKLQIGGLSDIVFTVVLVALRGATVPLEEP